MSGLQAAYDPLYAAAQRSITAQGEINQLRAAGIFGDQQAAESIARVTSAYAAQVDSINAAAAASRQISGAAAVNSASAVNARLGVSDPAGFQSDREAEYAEAFAAAVDDAAAAVGRLQAAYDPLYTATERSVTAQAEINRLRAAGVLGDEQAEGLIERVTAAYVAQTSAITAASAAASGSSASVNSASAINARLGVSDPVGFQSDREAAYQAAFADAADAADKLRAELVPLAAAENTLQAALEKADAAERANIVTAEEAAAARKAAQGTYDRTVASLKDVQQSSGAAGAAARNLGIQFTQGISGIVTGQPVLEVLIQQGHQVIDSSLAMGEGFGGIATAAKGMLAAIGGLPTLVGVGLAGAFVAAGASAISNQNALGSLRSTLRATRDDYAPLADTVDAVARKVAASTSLTLDEARKIGAEISGSKYFSGTADDLERLSREAIDVGRTLGVDAYGGSKIIRGGLDDATKAAQGLADQGFRTLSPEIVKQIALLDASGHSSEATALLTQRLAQATRGAGDDVSSYSKAWTELGNAVSGAERGWTPVNDFFGNVLAGSIRSVTYLVQELSSAIKNVPTISIGSLLFSPTSTAANDGNPAVAAQGASRLGGASGAAGSTASGLAGVRDQVAQLVGIDTEAFRRLIAAEAVQLPDGSFATSATGARGPGQLLPSTYAEVAQKYGIPGSIDDTRSNLTAAAYYFRDRLNTPGVSALPGDQQLYAATLGYHDGPSLIAPGSTRQPSSAALAEASTVATGYTGTPITPGLVDDAKKLNDELTKQVENTRAIKEQQLDADLAKVQQQMVAVAAASGTDSAQYQGLVQRSQELTAARYQNVDAQTEANRASDSGVRASAGLTAAEVALNAALEQRRQLALSSGAPFTDADASKVAADLTAKQTQELDRLNFSLANTAANSITMARAYDEGDQSVVDATAKQAAYNQALTMFVPGTEAFSKGYKDLVIGYKQTAEAAAEAKDAQQNLQDRNNLDYIAAETASLGQDTDARSKMLAVLKAEQAEHVIYGDILPKEAQDHIELAGRISDATVALQHQQQVLGDVTGAFSSMADTLTNDVTQAFVQGQGAAVNWGNIIQGIESQVIGLISKLAIVNPLLNAIDGGTRSTLSGVLGLAGNLFGGGSGNTVSTDSGSFTVGGDAGIGGGLVLNRDGNSVSPSDLTADDLAVKGQTGTFGANGQISFSTALGTAATGAKALDFISGGKLLAGAKDFVFDAVGYTPGTTVGQWVSSLVGEDATTVGGLAGATTIGEVAGVAGDAAAAAGVSGAAAASATTAASVVGGETVATGTLGAAASTIAEAVPYIGAAVSIITDLATGNLRGAAIVATTTAVGAVVGSVIPGIGTAIGAGVGATVGVLIDTFFPQHPKNPYQATDVDVDSSGHIVAGRSVSQLESTDAAQQEINDFGDQLGQYLDAVKVDIVNRGNLGNVGSNIKGLTQVDDVTDLFPNLRFTNDPSDTGNFGIAKQGDLADASFANVGALNDELTKVAKFSDGLDQLGIKLYSVGKGLTDITIASVSLTGALDAQGNAIINPDADPNAAPDPLRVALDTDLSGKTFANVDALGAEIDKVETFVDTTLPGLLNPVVAAAVSSLQQQIADENKTYDAAESQAAAYGLDTAPLYAAETKADSLLIAPARKQLDQQEQGINDRDIVATHTDPISQFQASFNDLQVTDEQQRDALIKSLTDVYGDSVKGTAYYFQQLGELNQTLADEATAKIQAFQRQQVTNGLTLAAANAAIQGRADVLAGDQEGSDLVNYDAKAAQERDSYSNQLLDFYGQQYATTQAYADQINALEQVEGGERLAIVQKYADAATQATAQAAQVQQQQLVQAQDNVASLYSSLSDYATKLQTGSNSPLSAQDQYALASSQFNAVLGAAQAGDYTSAGQLQSYSDTLLSASRAINESGTGYAADFQRVLDGLQSVTTVSDALTASAQKQIAQDATDQQNAALQDVGGKITDAITALRREVQMLNLKLTNQAA